MRSPFHNETSGLLIVCNDQGHMQEVQASFEKEAFYTTWQSPLTGRRFDKIICFKLFTNSEVEKKTFLELVTEYLPTKLRAGSKEFHLI